MTKKIIFKALFRSPKTVILSLFLHFGALTVWADSPPEILTATSPQTYVINGVGGQESGIVAYASVCDAAGNTFVAGSFAGQSTFGTNLVNSSGGYALDDVYLVKYDAAGKVLWARRAGGSDREIGRAIALDGAGGVFLTGTTSSSPSVFGTNTLYVAGKSMYLARYDGNGNCLWAKKGGSWQSPAFTFVSSIMTVNGLAVDSAGNAVVGGSFNGNPKFGGVITNQSFPYLTDGGIILSNRNAALAGSYEDLFVAKYSADGGLLWATNYGGTNTEFASAVAVDSAGAVYAGGGFKLNTTMGAVTYTNVDNGLLLVKFSSDGKLVWSSNLSDATNSNQGYGWSVAVDSVDRVSFGFEVKTSVPFRFSGVAITNTLSGPGFTPVYMGLLAQFDAAGTLRWLKRTPFNGSGNGFPANSSSLAVDAQNNLYFGSASAQMSGATFGTGGLGLLKYSANGAELWTNFVPQLSLTFQPPSVSVDAGGIIHGVATIKGDKPALLTMGWINYYPFAAFGNNQLLFTIASNFVSVAPIFLQQPTNMLFQPPQGISNSAAARGWPAPKYFWYMTGSKLTNATNFSMVISPTTFTNRTSYFVVASNGYGMTTSLVVNAQAGLAFAPSPPTNVQVLVGTSLTVSAGATGTTAISFQWRFNGTNIANANSATLALQAVATNQSGSYTLVISNATGVLTSTPPSVVTVLPYGSVDGSWTNLFSAYLGGILGLARSPDGGYYAVNGVNAARVQADGTLDTNGFINLLSRFYRWNDGSPGDQYLGPLMILREPDGKLLICGTFKVYYQTPGTVTNVNRMARLNADGTLDGTFNSGLGATNSLDGPSFSKVESVIRLPNGQYLVAGTFNRFNGVATTNLVRLNNDGSRDTTFPGHTCKYSSSGTSPGVIHRIALQADGKILVAGEFELFDGVANHNLTRLNGDGTADSTFSQTTLPAPPFGRVQNVLPLPDGKILVAGSWNNMTNIGVSRLFADGSRDASWLGVMPGETFALSLMPNNKLILAGNGFVRRTSYDGASDATFNPGASFSGQQTYSVVQEPSGNLMVCGAPYGMRRLLLEPVLGLPSFSAGAGVGMVNGQFQFSACGGVEGQSIVVQASTNLTDWVNVSTNVVSGGCIIYTDSQVPAVPNRYYRMTGMP